MYLISFSLCVVAGFLCIGAPPVEELSREVRSPHIHKKPFHFGGGFGGGPSYDKPPVSNNYITNINNYGPGHGGPGGGPGGPGYGGGSYAGSAAFAGGHGQSQASAFSFGPFSAAFSQAFGSR